MMNIADIEKAIKLMEEAQGILGRGPLSFYLREIAASYRLLMERFCPFKVGSRVQLRETPDITPETAPGWMSCKHFLVKGAKGVVTEAACGEGGFVFYVEFDNETYIHPHTHKPAKPESKYVFTFREAALAATDRTAEEK